MVRRRLRFALLMISIVSTCLPFGASVLASAGVVSESSLALPVVSPVPQSIRAFSFGFELSGSTELVTAERTDRAAAGLTAGLLRDAGVPSLHGQDGSGITVYVGGPTENPASAQALKELGVNGPEGLPPGGYVLAVGDHKVVLAGVDPAGTFYAAQTLRQLVYRKGDRTMLPGVVIQDFPAFGLRGGMESFYGNAWAQADLLRHLDWLGQHRMNAFQYIVSGDPRTTGALWRSPYPAADLARFQEAIARARANHVVFIYRINPENAGASGICHALQSDMNALIARYQQLYDIGERTFSLGWDDVGGQFACQLDRDTFNGRPHPLAAAQAHVVNHVIDNFIRTHAEAKLVTVPTDYAGTHTSTYRSEFARLIPADVPIFWTGREVISPTIPLSELTQAKQAFGGRQMLIFDNYPVNDYAPSRQHLAPLVGRDPGLSSAAAGFLANEMQEAEASLISLFTVAEYTWNPSAYDPQASWTRSLQEFGGAAYPALRTYAENSTSSPLHAQAAPVLQPLVTAFRHAYRSGGDVTGTGNALTAELAKVKAAPGQLRAAMTANPSFLRDSEPWFVALERKATAAQHAVRAVQAQAVGNGTAYQSELQSMGATLAGGSDFGRIVAPAVYEELFDLASSPRAAPMSIAVSGALSLHARGIDGRFHTSRQTSAGSGWTTVTALPGVTIAGQPDIVQMPNDLKTAFVRGADNQIWTNWQVGANSSWHGWVGLGGVATDSPTGVLAHNGALAVFARGADGQLWHQWQTGPGGTWSGHVPIPGIAMLGKPAIIVSRSGAMAAFVRGTDNRIWHNWQNAAGGTWHGWISLGGTTTNNPRAVMADTGAMSVFIRGTDGRIYTAWQSSEGGGWGGFAVLPSITAYGEPEVMKGRNGAMTAFVRGTDNQVWTNRQSVAGGAWIGWTSIGGSTTSGPAGIENQQGQFSVYALGANGNIFTSWQLSSTAWSGWANLGGSLSG